MSDAPTDLQVPAAAPEQEGSSDESTLCIDIGGSGIKGGTVGPDGTMAGERIRIPTTYPLRPDDLLDAIGRIAAGAPPAARVSVGFPGMIRHGYVYSAPHFITAAGPGTEVVPDLVEQWRQFPLAERVEKLTGLHCRTGNDADVQGLAAISGKGLEVVLTLGTGLGSAVFLDGELGPHLELAHHPLHKGKTYDEMVGDAARRKAGNEKWSARVEEMAGVVYELLFYDALFLGGGNAGKLTPAFTREATIVDNTSGILGGAKLWSLTRLP